MKTKGGDEDEDFTGIMFAVVTMGLLCLTVAIVILIVLIIACFK